MLPCLRPLAAHNDATATACGLCRLRCPITSHARRSPTTAGKRALQGGGADAGGWSSGLNDCGAGEKRACRTGLCRPAYKFLVCVCYCWDLLYSYPRPPCAGSGAMRRTGMAGSTVGDCRQVPRACAWMQWQGGNSSRLVEGQGSSYSCGHFHGCWQHNIDDEERC